MAEAISHGCFAAASLLENAAFWKMPFARRAGTAARLGDLLLASILALTGKRLAWFRGISAHKL